MQEPHHEKVEKAIWTQVAGEELKLVDHRVWAAPIVMVTKKKWGHLYLCRFHETVKREVQHSPVDKC